MAIPVSYPDRSVIIGDRLKNNFYFGYGIISLCSRKLNSYDDFSRELYTAILSDKTQYSAAKFPEQVVNECPYTIEAGSTGNKN